LARAGELGIGDSETWGEQAAGEPEGTFRHPPGSLEGLTIRTASPLAPYQLRVGIAKQGAFGALSAHQRAASE
jgi:hypothetical protein